MTESKVRVENIKASRGATPSAVFAHSLGFNTSPSALFEVFSVTVGDTHTNLVVAEPGRGDGGRVSHNLVVPNGTLVRVAEGVWVA